jgi:cytidine deaminase
LSDSESRPLGGSDRRQPSERRGSGDLPSGVDRPQRDGPEDHDRLAGGEGRTDERRGSQDRRSEAGWQPVTLDDAAVRVEAADSLIAAAASARLRAHARYSHFLVGAALETEDGQVITGCNIENATYGLTLCAERVALVKALSEGCELFTRIAVVADTPSVTPPCGACRQLLWEYCGDIDVIIANLDGAQERHRLSALLPLPFDSRLLK